MATVRIGSISVAFRADTQEFVGPLKNSRRAMQFLRQESARTGIAVGELARRAGLSAKQFQEMQRAEKVAIARTKALRREVRLLTRRMEQLRKQHFNLRNIITSVAGASGIGLMIRQLTQYSAQLSETADALGLLPSQLDAVRKQFGSFGLDVLQTDRLLSNVVAKMAEARRGSERLAGSFRYLGVESLSLNDPLEIIGQIAASYPSLPRGQGLEALRLVLGERYAIPVGGLLSTQGQFQAELERINETFKDFSNTAVRTNKTLDQAFIDLGGQFRIQFQNVVARNALVIKDIVNQLEKLAPAIAKFSLALTKFFFENRATFTGGAVGVYTGVKLLEIYSKIESAGGFRNFFFPSRSGQLNLFGKGGALASLIPFGKAGLIAGGVVIAGAGAGAARDRYRNQKIERERLQEALRVAEESRKAVEGLSHENFAIFELNEQLFVLQHYLANATEEFKDLNEQRLELLRRGKDPEKIALRFDIIEAREELVKFGTATQHIIDNIERITGVPVNAIFSGLIDQLLSEIDVLNQLNLEWDTYGARITELTTQRDIAQLGINLKELQFFNTQNLHEVYRLVGATWTVQLESIQKDIILQQQRNRLIREGLGLQDLDAKARLTEEQRIGAGALEARRLVRIAEGRQPQYGYIPPPNKYAETIAVRLSDLIADPLARGIIRVSRDVFERTQRDVISRDFPRLPLVDSKLETNLVRPRGVFGGQSFVRDVFGSTFFQQGQASDIRILEPIKQIERAKLGIKETSEELEKQTELYTRAIDRALRGIADALTNVVVALAKGEGAMRAFVNSLASIATELLRLFINAGLINLASRSGLPGFARGGLASGFAIVGERGPEVVDFRTPSRVYPNDYFGGSAQAKSVTYNIQAVEANTVRAVLENIKDEIKFELLDDIRTSTDMRSAIQDLVA